MDRIETGALLAILHEARKVQWFSERLRLTRIERALVLLHAREHLSLASLATRDARLADLRPVIRTGCWAEYSGRFSSHMRSGDASFSTPIDRGLDAVTERLHARAESDETVAALIQPPLWLERGLVNLVTPWFTLADDSAANIEKAPERYQQVAALILAQADCDLQDALAWALVERGSPAKNPFLPLIRLYALGAYPLGPIGDEFEVFCLQAQSPLAAPDGQAGCP